ncbi:MAG: hypothetical protein EAZ51_05555 [Sphingobacteriales bacterium]|nr:MAG: hypothetical protein EAZ51_05555 [Sphingobacteriales bacterium]
MSNIQAEKLPTQPTVLQKASSFINENQKSLSVILATVLALIALFFAYQKFYLAPREIEAANQMYKAQQYWEQKSWDKAIKGDGNFPGFEKIISDYDNTKSANLAFYYIGIAYLNKGEYQKAAENLSNYNGNDAIVAPLALGGAGDAYVELKDYDNAISYFKKAADKGNNLFTAPMYLKKLGLVYEEKNDFQSAVDTYKKIKTDYPESTESSTIDMYIARAEGKL